jgi:hypothetical protein
MNGKSDMVVKARLSSGFRTDAVLDVMGATQERGAAKGEQANQGTADMCVASYTPDRAILTQPKTS